MNNQQSQNSFYFKMGVALLLIVIAGFGSAMLVRQTTPLDFPLIFHLHAAVYLAWFTLFIVQTKLIKQQNYLIHRRLGFSSIALVVAMVVTGFLLSTISYSRGVSPVPNTTIQQFIALPLLDLTGLIIFVTLGFINRAKADTHKHCMLMASIAILDPAIARFTISLGVPPLAILLHVGLVLIVALYDKRSAAKVNIITWCGLAFVILRIAFVFTIAGSSAWASFVTAVYG